MKKLFPFIVIILFATACNNESHEHHTTTEVPKTQADTLLKEVIEGHDEAMAAQMTKMKAAKEKVSHAIDSLEKLSGAAASALKTQLNAALLKLNDADAAMNKWMEDFNYDSAKNNIEERVKYLAEEKLKVGNVKNMIFESLGKTDSLINTFKR